MTARQQAYTSPEVQLTPVNEEILRALNRFRFLTAAQLNRLFWPGNTRDRNRHAQRRLHDLARSEYALVIGELPTPNGPAASLVYTLDWRGRKALAAAGERVPKYYRPSELAEAARNPWFMPHALAVVDVLIAVERFAGAEDDIQLRRVKLEGDLRRHRLRVTMPPAGARTQPRPVTVVPDALFSLDLAGERQEYVVELDRGTERQQKWRDKVAALATWITSPQSKVLLPGAKPSVTVLVVTESPQRRRDLLAWTQKELTVLGLFEHYAHLFVVTCASPVALSPEEFFTEPHWYPVSTGAPVALI